MISKIPASNTSRIASRNLFDSGVTARLLITTTAAHNTSTPLQRYLDLGVSVLSQVLGSAVQCSAVQCSIVQYSVVQYSAVQCSTVQ
jgi:hypothetical protein